MIDLSRVFDMRQTRIPAASMALDAGNPTTTKIPSDYPIDYLECRLVGTLTVGTETATLLALGFLNLITRLTLTIDGKTVVFDAPGRLLGLISDLYTQAPGKRTDPTMTAGATAFEYAFRIPINGGPDYFSLLDVSEASGRSELVMRVDWASDLSLCESGDTTADDAVSACYLHVDAIGVAGGVVGQPGGVGFAYPLHLIDFANHPITAVQSDMEIALLRQHMYRRIGILAQTTSSVPSDAVLNALKLQVGQSRLQAIERESMQAEMVAKGYVASVVTGWQVLDLCGEIGGVRWPRISDMVGVRSGLDLRVYADVLNPGTDSLVVVRDHYVNSGIERAAA